MKIAVVGPGAIGCLFGAALGRAGHEVWLVDRRPERARILAQQGIQVSGVSGEFRALLHATAVPAEAAEAGVVVVSVKSYDTEGAAETTAAVVGAETTVLTMQNGLGNMEALVRRLGADRVLGGVTSQGASLTSPGVVRHAGEGPTLVGEPDGGASPRARRLAALLTEAGLEAEPTDNLQGALWTKLAANAGINALGALARVRNGALLDSPDLRELLRGAVREVEAVARAKRIQLLEADMAAYAETICRQTAGNVNSMLQDVRRGRRTEVDAINGAVAREGETLGVPTPVNTMLAGLIRGLEQTYQVRISD